MASARKKQDEKHVKILRELVSLSANKECFDCHQRGPTYVNMTIGSFVCTTCSGMLRGLTPPHRVKSISMASFTPEEVEMVKSRGNEYCRRVWLGLFDVNHAQDTKDEQQVKDFMIAKYERKRYYLEPSAKNGPVNFSPPGTQSHSRTSTPTPMTSIPETKLLTNVHGSQTKPSSLNIKASNISSSDSMFTPEKPSGFLNDFGQSDPFSSSQFTPTTTPSFANFENNPVFNSANFHFFGNTVVSDNVPARFNTNRWSMPTAAALSTMSNNVFGNPARKSASSMGVSGSLHPQPPSEDRYAALKDLDSLMKSQQSADAQGNDWAAGTWPSTNTSTAPVSVFGSPSQNSQFVTATTGVSSFPEPAAMQNPFTVAGVNQNPWIPTSENGVSTSSSQPVTFQANPFRNGRQSQQGFGIGTESLNWNTAANSMPNGQVPNGGIASFHSQVPTAAMAFPTSQSMNFPAKPWQPIPPSGNPFMLGTIPTPAGHSSNPFL